MSFSEQVEIRDGLVWPKIDQHVLQVTMNELPGVNVYCGIPRYRRVVVQAGGNCGIFPRAMADLFDTVYTFEPDPLNFYCLVQNASASNIVKFQAGLGVDRQLLRITPLYPDNIAGFAVAPGGYIPTMRIDDLGLNCCDLIQLDVEGSEFGALLGARETITRHRPVIVLELKGLPGSFGAEDATVLALLSQMGYRSQQRFANDEIFVPAEYQGVQETV